MERLRCIVLESVIHRTDTNMIDLRLERLPDVLARRGDGRTSFYGAILRREWTKPIRMGRASTWPAHETQTLLAARIAGATSEQMRELVRALHAKRAALMPADTEGA
jgi:prophage regulatory protein